MNAGDEMEEDDDDDVDFNPYLRPSPDRESDESFKRVEDSDDSDEGGAGGKHGKFVDNSLGQLFGQSKLLAGDDDRDGKISGFADKNEERKFQEAEQENITSNVVFRSDNFPSKENNLERANAECSESVREADQQTCAQVDMSVDQSLDEFKKAVEGRGSNISLESGVLGAQDSAENCLVHLAEGECQPKESVDTEKSDEDGEDIMDAISKRTRAHLSLTDMSLDQLETFLQESDEEDYFQTVDDEEEYRKFLQAVQEDDGTSKEPNQNGRKDDEDDEEDVDFEVEIEEALESDGASESHKGETRRRPETRGKKQQNGQSQRKVFRSTRSSVPLRHLLPHVGKVSGNVSMVERRRAMSERLSLGWPSFMHRSAPVSGFTAHQIGQLYCLMHEHVQLLVQVLSLCILEPSRQQIVIDTQRLLMELAEKREFMLSWKKTAFPDFCFRPPYTHPSLVEGSDHITSFQNLNPDISVPTMALPGQNSQIMSDFDSRTSLARGSTPEVPFVTRTWIDSPGQSTAMTSPRFPVLNTSELAPSFPASENIVQSTAGAIQPWQANFPPFSAQIPVTTLRQGSQPASERIGPAYGALPGSVADSRSLVAGQIRFGGSDGLFQSPASDPTSSTATGVFPSAAAANSPSIQLIPRSDSNNSTHATSNHEGSVITSIQATSSGECAPISKCAASFPIEQVQGGWAPTKSGPVRSLMDVAPLALVREFLTEVSHVVEEYRKRHVETGDYHMQCEREPLFAVSLTEERDQNGEGTQTDGVRVRLFGGGEHCIPTTHPPLKKTMAAALVESTKKESLALVPKDAAIATRRFLPYFNKEFFPHKAPPAATAKRLLFTDAEDELLAMGLMMYNTDWRAIQQRYLPSKSQHQIFVRQKNRSSARAPENSIKAVRRMKSSPLTRLEMSSIQEGLGVFKHDWNKVWQFCVPHRDPTVLPRQWRIAVGTQKSYKTSESSKEKRRLYEASRRQKIKNASMAIAVGEENGHLLDALMHVGELEDNRLSEAVTNAVELENTDGACAKTDLDSSSGPLGEKDLDDIENDYIREAFMDDWCTDNAPIFSEPAEATGAKQRKSGSKKRKAKVLLESSSSISSPWLDSQAVKQTVKLAPGLPSVKLPSCVQVLSQSQVQSRHPLSFAVNFAASSMQWTPMTNRDFDRLELSAQAQAQVTHLQSLSISNIATGTRGSGVNTSGKPGQPSSHSLARRKKPLPKSEQTMLTIPTHTSSRNSSQAKPPARDSHTDSFPCQPSLELASAMDSVHGRQPYQESTSVIPDQCPVQVSLDQSGVSSAFEPSPVQAMYSLTSAASRDEEGMIPGGSDCKGLTFSQDALLLAPANEHRNQKEDYTTGLPQGISQNGNEMQIHGGLGTGIQASLPNASAPPRVDDQLNTEAATGLNDLEFRLQIDSFQARPRKKGGREDSKPRRSYAKRCQKARPAPQHKSSKQAVTRAHSLAEGPQNSNGLSAQGVVVPNSNSSRRSRQKDAGKGRKRGHNAFQPAHVESVDQDMDQLSIVMEQEELSDSEDEVGADVEFEHEEMGDSDKDDDL